MERRNSLALLVHLTLKHNLKEDGMDSAGEPGARNANLGSANIARGWSVCSKQDKVRRQHFSKIASWTPF